MYGGSFTAAGPTIPSIAATFGLTLGTAGSVFAIGGAGFVLVVFLGGYAADVFGKRGVLAGGLVVAALGFLTQGLAPSFAALLVGTLAVYVGSGLLESALGGLIVDLHPTRRTSALNLLHSSFGWGALLGPLFAGALLITVGWRWVYLSLGFAFAVAAVLVARQRYPDATAGEPVRRHRIGPLLRNRVIQLAVLGILLYVAAELSLSTWGFPYLESVRGYPTMLASLGVSLFWAGIALGRALSAWLSVHTSARALVQISAAVFAVGAGLLLLAPSAELSLAAMAVAGLGAAALYPTIMAMACAQFPRLSGTVTGVVSTATGAGMLIGPPSVGILGDALGLERSLLAVVVAMAVVVAVYHFDGSRAASS